MKLFNKKDEIKEVETVVDEEGNVVEVEKKKPSFKEWVKNHKKGLAIGAVGLTALAAGLAAGIGMAVKNHKKNEAKEDDLYYDEDDEDEDETEDDDSDEENESEESTED